MKKSILLILAMIVILTMNAQTNPPAKTVAKPALVLKNLTDSASYAVGLSVANFYKQQGVSKLNAAIVSQAINDILSGKKPLCDEGTANNIMNRYLNKQQEEKAKPVITEGQKFLAQNKLRPEVKTTASGLQYEILTEGTGPKPSRADSVVCHYKGTLLNGTEFDNSYNRGQPISFSVTGVIAGWTEGLQLMNEGSKYKFYVPYNLAYGAFDYGNIPGGSMLTFEVELLAVKKAQ